MDERVGAVLFSRTPSRGVVAGDVLFIALTATGIEDKIEWMIKTTEGVYVVKPIVQLEMCRQSGSACVVLRCAYVVVCQCSRVGNRGRK